MIMKRSKNNILILLFFGFLLLMLILFILIPKRSFSAQENRSLQSKPDLSAENIQTGRYMEQFDQYISDHFPLRNTWITAKAACEYIVGKRDSNGIYYGHNGQLFPQFETPDYTKLDQKISWINEWSTSTSPPLYFCLIPSASVVQNENLPNHAFDSKESDAIDYCYSKINGSQIIDLRETLTKYKTEKLYYWTDHHWTSFGAKTAFDEIQRHLNSPAFLDTSVLTPTSVCADFYGTSYSASGYTWVKPDTIETYIDSDSVHVESFQNGIQNEPVTMGLYDENMLTQKDKYSYFLGGISPLVHVKNPNCPPSSLLLIRDSYSDSITPFLSQDYSDIYLIDLRYFKNSIQGFVTEHAIDSILILYSMKNFSEDNNLGLLLG